MLLASADLQISEAIFVGHSSKATDVFLKVGRLLFVGEVHKDVAPLDPQVAGVQAVFRQIEQ